MARSRWRRSDTNKASASPGAKILGSVRGTRTSGAIRAGTPPLWRLLVGKEPSTSAAETLARQIREEQSIPEAFVVRLDPGQGVD